MVSTKGAQEIIGTISDATFKKDSLEIAKNTSVANINQSNAAAENSRASINKLGEFEKKIEQIKSMNLSPEEEKRAILQVSGGAERGPSEIAQLGLLMKQDAVATTERNRKYETKNKIENIKADSLSKGVDEDNVGRINALLESIGEPPYEAIEVSPEVKRRFGEDTPAKYKYVQRAVPIEQKNGDGLISQTAKSQTEEGQQQPSTSLTQQQIAKIETRISAEKDPERKKAMQAEYDKMKGVK